MNKLYPAVLTIMLTTYSGLTLAATSNTILQSVDEVKCDGVDYPVALSVNPYTEEAGTPILLNKGNKNTISATQTKSTTNTVADTYSHKVTLSLGFEPKIGDATTKGSAAYEWGHSITYTNAEQVTFAQTQTLSVTPKISGMTATPTYFKTQMWGAYYRCENKSKEKKQVSAVDSIKLDVTTAQGWVFSCPNRTDSKCVLGTDYTAD